MDQNQFEKISFHMQFLSDKLLRWLELRRFLAS